MSEHVPWQMLPANPMGFFGLKEGFDRRDLKRAYGRLIKRFKPETHPAEFQRIREAYEVLESQNRYGVQQQQLSQMTAQWNLQPVGSASPASAGVDAVGSVELAVRDPRATYQRLARQKTRSPQDYFVLATLADLVDRDSKQMYLRWLLTGAKEYPRDPGLLKLVTEYLSGFTNSKLAASTLLTLSKIVKGDDFFPVSERLWIRLFREVPFAEFAKVLQACESNLKHGSLRSRIVFYVRILRYAVWKAPRKWLDQRLAYIEQHGSDIPDGLDEELEFVLLLNEYVAQDRGGLEGSPVRVAIDRMLETYCTRPWSEAATSVSSLCDELARNGHGVQEVFPTDESESSARLLSLCSIVASDVAQQTGLDFSSVGRERVEAQAARAAADLEETIQDVAGRITRMRWRVFGLPFLMIWLGPIVLAMGFSFAGMFAIAWTFLVLVGHFAALKPMYLESRADEKTQQICNRAYEDQWRPRLFRYVQACHVPLPQGLQTLQAAGHAAGQGTIIDIILSYAVADPPLHFFAQLQMFQH